MPSAEELEQLLDVTLVENMKKDAAEHGWSDDEYARMLRMEASKARGDEHAEVDA